MRWKRKHLYRYKIQAGKRRYLTEPTEWMQDLDDFHAMCRRRMVSGMQEYGDKSFSKCPMELMREMQEECVDEHLWSFIRWRKVRQMMVAYKEVFLKREAPDEI